MPANNPFRLLTYDQLVKLPPTQILASTHLVARGFNVIFGPSGTFKSFYALSVALEVAQTAPVVFVAAEGAGGLAKRIDAWCDFYNRPPGQLYFVPAEVNLLDKAVVGQFAESVKTVAPKVALTVFDTYARCIPGGDENSSKDCGIAIQHCALIQRFLSTSVTLVHHTNRAERGERGSGALRGAADSMIEVSNHEDGLIKFECSKMKDDEPWDAEYYGFVQHSSSGVLIPAGHVPDPVDLSQQEIKILSFLTLEVFEKCGATSRQIIGGAKVSESSVYKILSRLKRNYHVLQDTKGDPYTISDGGRAVLALALSRSIAPPKVNGASELQEQLSNSQRTIN